MDGNDSIKGQKSFIYGPSTSNSDVATLGHTGAHWSTCPSNYRPCPTSAVLIVALLIANRLLNCLEIERRSIALCIHRIMSLTCESWLWYDFRTDCKIPGGGCSQIPLKASALSADVGTNVVCPCCALA